MRIGKNHRFPEFREELKASKIIPENETIPEYGEERIICKVVINRDDESYGKGLLISPNEYEEIIQIKITIAGN